MAATTIARDTLTNDDGTGTTGDIVNASNLAAWFYDNVDTLFTASQIIEASASGAALVHTVYNTADAASSDARSTVEVGGTSAGDPMFFLNVVGVGGWTIGIDNSVNDEFMVCRANTAVTEATAVFKCTTSRHFILPELTASPGTGDLAENAAVAIYTKNNRLVFAYNNAGAITYVVLELDGSDTTWYHGTSAP